MGYGSTASGFNSTAIGGGNTASGKHSTAMGYGTTASAYGSTAIGVKNIVRTGIDPNYWSPADEIFVIGNGSFNPQGIYNSNAFSVKRNGETYIQGNLGIGTETPTAKLEVAGDAKITGTLTIGGQSVVTTNQLNNYATTAQVAPYAKPTALYNNSGNAISSVGTDGKVNFASGLTSGQGSTASGEYSTAMGWGTAANGESSAAMGAGTTASGDNSTAMGADTTASGDSSTAMGIYTTASGAHSTAMGIHTTANAYGSTVIGGFNVIRPENSPSTWVASDDLFVIGNGRDRYDDNGNYITTRSNAFSVKKNGDTTVAGTLTVTKRATKLRVEQQGDIDMGSFTAGSDIP
jgi:hypothetical protein